MPNHIANKLVVESSKKGEIKRFLNFIKGNNKDEVIDFNTIIPMPNVLKDTEASTKTDKSVCYYLYVSNKLDELPKIIQYYQLQFPIEKILENSTQEELDKLYLNGKKYYDIYKETNFITWYDWCNWNWGTKWNAYSSYLGEVEEDTATIFFQTAWNGVSNIIIKLVSLFPNIHFDYKFADEDMCHNCGCGDGNEEDGFYFEYCQSNSEEAMETYAECWEEDIDEFIQLPDGYWTKKEWLEDEEES